MLITSLMAQAVKRLPTMPTIQETWVRSLGQKDLLEKEMATHFSILAWTTPWMVEPGRLQSIGSQRVRHDRATSLTHSLIDYVAYLIIFVYFLLTKACITMDFLISASFVATHRVWKVVFPFPCVSRYFLISSLSSSLKHCFF